MKFDFSEILKKIKVPLLVLGGVVLVLGGLVVVKAAFLKTELIVMVAPIEAKVEIDGKVYENGRGFVSLGKHSVRISKEGFSESEFEVEAKFNEPVLIYEYLAENGGEYSDEDFDVLSLIAEDEETIEGVNEYFRKDEE